MQDEHFEDAQQFIPERWLRSNKAKNNAHPFASVPFGFGPRACIGRRFAEQESHVALIKVICKISFITMKSHYVCLLPSTLICVCM